MLELTQPAGDAPQAYLGSDTTERSGDDVPNNGAITPCGLIGWSQFNDTFEMQQEESGASRSVEVGLLPKRPANYLPDFAALQPERLVPYLLSCSFDGRLQILEEGIAWPSDKKYLFGDVPSVNYNINATLRGGNTTEQLLSESEHLMVWFRTSSKPDIVYRWGTIKQDLEPGSYRLKVWASPLPSPTFLPGSCSKLPRFPWSGSQASDRPFSSFSDHRGILVLVLLSQVMNRYNSYGFCGEKRFVLTTNSWVGGGRRFLSILYLAAGCGFLATLIFFLLAFFFWRRRETGNADDLSWNRDVKRGLLPESPMSPADPPPRKSIPTEAQGLI